MIMALLISDLFPGSKPYVFTGSDDAMIFRSNISATRASGTRFPRSRLREIQHRGNSNISPQDVNENN